MKGKRKYKVNKNLPEVKWALSLLKLYGLTYSFSKPMNPEAGASYNPQIETIKFRRHYFNLDDFLSALFHELCHHISAHEGAFPMCYRPDLTTRKGQNLFKQNYFKMEFHTDNKAEKMMKFYFPERKYYRSYFNDVESKEVCLNQAKRIIKKELEVRAAIDLITKWQKGEIDLSDYLK